MQMVEDLTNLAARIPVARLQDERTRAREADTRARLQDVFKVKASSRPRMETVSSSTPSKASQSVSSSQPGEGDRNQASHVPRRRYLSISERLQARVHTLTMLLGSYSLCTTELGDNRSDAAQPERTVSLASPHTVGPLRKMERREVLRSKFDNLSHRERESWS
jgi:hypothetical protein